MESRACVARVALQSDTGTPWNSNAMLHYKQGDGRALFTPPHHVVAASYNILRRWVNFKAYTCTMKRNHKSHILRSIRELD